MPEYQAEAGAAGVSEANMAIRLPAHPLIWTIADSNFCYHYFKVALKAWIFHLVESVFISVCMYLLVSVSYL